MENTIITLSGQSLQARLRVALSEAEALEAKHAQFENASSGGLGLNTKHGEAVNELSGTIDSSTTIMGGRQASNKFVWGLIAYGVVCCLPVFFALKNKPELLENNTARISYAVIIFIPIMIYMVIAWKKTLAKKKALHEEIKELMGKLTAFYEVPESYRYSFALSYMLGLIKAGRASTWRECVEKYEVQVHRWTVEANTAEAAAHAESAARNARLAAFLIAWKY